MATFTLTEKGQTAVSELAKLFESTKDVEVTIIAKEGELKYERTFKNPEDKTHSILNNASYTLRKKLGWIVAKDAPAAPAAPADPNAPAPEKKAAAPRKASAPAATKIYAEFNLENGTAAVKVGEKGDGVTYDAETDTWAIPGPVLSTYSAKLSGLAASPRAAFAGVSEMRDGKILFVGWQIAGYASKFDGEAEAVKDILMQAVVASDGDFLAAHSRGLMTGEEHLTKTNAGVKMEWVLKWTKEPAPAPVPAPSKPSETPPAPEDVAAGAGDPAGTGEAHSPESDRALLAAERAEAHVEAPAEAPVEVQAEAQA